MILTLAKQNLENLTNILTSIHNKVNGLSDPNFMVKKIDLTANFENKFENDFEGIIMIKLNEILLTSKQEEYINLSYLFNENNSLEILIGFENIKPSSFLIIQIRTTYTKVCCDGFIYLLFVVLGVNLFGILLLVFGSSLKIFL